MIRQLLCALSLVARRFLCYLPETQTKTTVRKDVKPIITYDKKGFLDPDETKALIEQSLDADKAFDITVIHLDDQSCLADYMIIASGTSSRHVAALAEKVKNRLLSRGIKNIRIDGKAQSDWVVLDAGDVIVHLFRPEVRSFYNIEKMWSATQPLEVVETQHPA